MRLLVIPPIALVVFAGSGDVVHAQQRLASTPVLATATVAARPSLTVSTAVLEFRIEPGATHAEAVVDFAAAMRALPNDEVVLTVQPDGPLRGPGGAADVETALSFSGDAPGIQTGILESARAAAVARWSGGGQRRGRLVFRLRASAPGVYSVPIACVLGTP